MGFIFYILFLIYLCYIVNILKGDVIMNIDNVYAQLTNVDIEEQKKIWDERGKGYYGEYLLFNHIYRHLTGFGKVLMNLNIPVSNNKTTEIDVILIHETGLYVFEVKHYKGTIYGKNTDKSWTQYFIQAENQHFNNPILQNNYHISALNNLFPDIPKHSFIVFTSSECTLRIENNSPDVDICTLDNIQSKLENKFFKSTKRFSKEEINDIFIKLSPFSQMKQKVIIDRKEADFLSWVTPTIEKLEESQKEVESVKQALNKEIEKTKQSLISERASLHESRKKGIIFNIIIAILCVIISAFICSNIIKKNTNELNTFKQKFQHINQIDNKYFKDLSSYVSVSNIQLSQFHSDVVSFTARISMSNPTYGIALTEASTYIVMLDDGNVLEYNVFGEHLNYNAFANIIGKGIRDYGDLSTINLYGISDTNTISYIKLTGINLFQVNNINAIIKDNLEIELYSK